MTTAKTIDVREFARRVEHLCDFLLDRLGKDGSKDVLVLQEIREEAADIIFFRAEPVSKTIDGLDDHMRGLNRVFEDQLEKAN